MDAAAKRRKWDVVGGSSSSRAGIGNAGVTGFGHPAYGGPALDHLPQGTSLAGPQQPGSLPPGVSFVTPAPPAVPASNKPLDDDTVRRIQESAAAVVERLNQDLIARGILPPKPAQPPAHPGAPPAAFPGAPHLAGGAAGQNGRDDRGGGKHEIFREVSINNAPPKTRFHLTKRSTMADIEHRWHVLVVVRGRYYPPGTPESEQKDEKPLCLRITPGGQLPQDPAVRERACTFAATDIIAILNNSSRPDPAQFLRQLTPAAPPPQQQPAAGGPGAGYVPGAAYPPPPQQPGQAPLIALPSYPPPPGGGPPPQGQLGQGQMGAAAAYPPPPGSAAPPVQYAPPPGQYAPPPQQQQQPQYASPPQYAPPNQQPGPSQQQAVQQQGAAPAGQTAPSPYPTRGKGFFCLYLGLEAPAEFDAVGRLQGPGGSYLQHIERAAQVSASLAGRGSGAPTAEDVPEPPLHVRIDCEDTTRLLEAVRLAGNLIDTIREDYKKAYPSAQPPPPSGNYDPPPPPAPTASPSYQQQQQRGAAPWASAAASASPTAAAAQQQQQQQAPQQQPLSPGAGVPPAPFSPQQQPQQQQQPDGYGQYPQQYPQQYGQQYPPQGQGHQDGYGSYGQPLASPAPQAPQGPPPDPYYQQQQQGQQQQQLGPGGFGGYPGYYQQQQQPPQGPPPPQPGFGQPQPAPYGMAPYGGPGPYGGAPGPYGGFVPPPGGSVPPARPPPSGPPGGYGGYPGYGQPRPQQRGPPGRGPEQAPAPVPPKRRFQELKPEDQQQQAPPKLPPYAAQYQHQHQPMGPPPPRSMGPPPPRPPGGPRQPGPMGPPPPRPRANQGMVLPGMEAYAD